MDKLRVLNDFVFIREVVETVSPGGILLVKEKRRWSPHDDHKEGIVVAVGPGKTNKKGRTESMWGIEPGQKVAFSPNGNFTQRVDGEYVTVVRRDSIIGTVEERHAA